MSPIVSSNAARVAQENGRGGPANNLYRGTSTNNGYPGVQPTWMGFGDSQREPPGNNILGNTYRNTFAGANRNTFGGANQGKQLLGTARLADTESIRHKGAPSGEGVAMRPTSAHSDESMEEIGRLGRHREGSVAPTGPYTRPPATASMHKPETQVNAKSKKVLTPTNSDVAEGEEPSWITRAQHRLGRVDVTILAKGWLHSIYSMARIAPQEPVGRTQIHTITTNPPRRERERRSMTPSRVKQVGRGTSRGEGSRQAVAGADDLYKSIMHTLLKLCLALVLATAIYNHEDVRHRADEIASQMHMKLSEGKWAWFSKGRDAGLSLEEQAPAPADSSAAGPMSGVAPTPLTQGLSEADVQRLIAQEAAKLIEKYKLDQVNQEMSPSIKAMNDAISTVKTAVLNHKKEHDQAIQTQQDLVNSLQQSVTKEKSNSDLVLKADLDRQSETINESISGFQARLDNITAIQNQLAELRNNKDLKSTESLRDLESIEARIAQLELGHKELQESSTKLMETSANLQEKSTRLEHHSEEIEKSIYHAVEQSEDQLDIIASAKAMMEEQKDIEGKLSELSGGLTSLQQDLAMLNDKMTNVDETPPVIADDVEKIAGDLIKRHDVERLGVPDYALENTGGSIVRHLSSLSYGMNAVSSLFDIQPGKGPSEILKVDVTPGNCWAFDGTNGYITIRLSEPIKPSAVTIDHIPYALKRHNTAPKDFIISTLQDTNDLVGTEAGRFQYQFTPDAEPVQTFPLTDANPTQFIKVHVTSNWGYPEFTSIYRVRVHGSPAELPVITNETPTIKERIHSKLGEWL